MMNNMQAIVTRSTREFWTKLNTRSLEGILARIQDQFEQAGATQVWYDEREAEIKFIKAELDKRGKVSK